jgi:hypothetical protein
MRAPRAARSLPAGGGFASRKEKGNFDTLAALPAELEALFEPGGLKVVRHKLLTQPMAFDRTLLLVGQRSESGLPKNQ